MVPIKALLTGLLGVSLCMANISGVVTDIGTTPIPGVVVQLEKGGQIDTTGDDGSFTLVVGGTGILPGHGKLLPNGLSAGITGNLMTLTIGERSVVEIATFDLNGKTLSNIRQTLETGVHTIALPQRSAGVYLYKVKSGNGEVVLKGNTIGGASSRSGVTAQSFSSNSLAKQAKAAAAINDIITVTKTGCLNYRCVQYNSDTTGLQIKMIASAGTLADTDGNMYQTVRIGNQVWMAENLRVTKYNDGTAILLGTSTATWNDATTPEYCYYNNMTDADSIKKWGPLYNWYVVDPANTKKIAPVGWHVPDTTEWHTLEKYMVLNGYAWDGTRDTAQMLNFNGLGKSLATKTDWITHISDGAIGNDLTKNNSSGFSGLPVGERLDYGMFGWQGGLCGWWSATVDSTKGVYPVAWYYNIREAGSLLSKNNTITSCGFSVRLVRD